MTDDTTRTITLDGQPYVVPVAIADWCERQQEAVGALATYAKQLEDAAQRRPPRSRR